MEESKIRKYAALMRELDLSALEIGESGKTLRLEREASPAFSPVHQPQIAVSPFASAPEPNQDSDSSVITSPMVGMFYSAPADGEKPFVSVGSKVKKGDTLCIIEAMKLMNEFTAESDCVIEEICVSNKQVVDFGCPLFRVRSV